MFHDKNLAVGIHGGLLDSGTEVANDWIDQTFREVNAGRRVGLPAAVGLCMCIRRDCPRDVGVFDADAFGPGYGEENDFCMRAARRGWRHVLSDPVKPYRFAVSTRSMRTSRKLVILTVNHALGGGLAPCLKQLCASVKHRADRVIAPSLDAAVRLPRYFPGLSPVAAYNPGTPAPPPLSPPPKTLSVGQPLRIAVLGVMAWHKSPANLQACTENARTERLPLEFTVIGYVDPHIPGKQPFRCSGRYESRHLPRLLRTLDSHLIWFPTQVPETFSLALSACIRLGLSAIVLPFSRCGRSCRARGGAPMDLGDTAELAPG